jgi:hypothetical protein
VLVTSSEKLACLYFYTQESISRLQRLQHLRLEGGKLPTALYNTGVYYDVEDADQIFR